MLSYVICAGLMVVVCYAQTPMPCASPTQWEGRRIRGDRAKEFFEIAKHSYDATNLRTRSIEEIDVGHERDFFDVLHLHNEAMEYRLNLRTKKCNVTSLTRPFRHAAIPLDAHFLAEAEIGAAGVAGESLVAEVWDGTFHNGNYTITVTTPSCIPISVDIRNSDESFHERYFDIHLGIADPQVFLPPPECS